jgi:hypothetical protein
MQVVLTWHRMSAAQSGRVQCEEVVTIEALTPNPSRVALDLALSQKQQRRLRASRVAKRKFAIPPYPTRCVFARYERRT